MKECPAFEVLSALVDGGLALRREAAVRRHLEGCVACRRQVDGMTALKRAVSRAHADDGPSPALRRVIAAKLSKRRREP